MKSQDVQDIFLSLVRLGIGHESEAVFQKADWYAIEALADRQGLLAIVLDGRDFYNCINAICVEDLGFNANIFPSVQNLPDLKEKVLNEILDPAIPNEKPEELFHRIVWKIKRWKANEWKHELCYKESMWSAFWSGVWGHLMKPSSI